MAPSAPNAALVDAGMDLPSSIMAPANWRGSSGDEWPRSARSPARLAADASGSGRIVGSVPPSTRAQLTGSVAISAAFVAAAANTTGVEAIDSPHVDLGGALAEGRCCRVHAVEPHARLGYPSVGLGVARREHGGGVGRVLGGDLRLDAVLGLGVVGLGDLGERGCDRGVGDDVEMLGVGASGLRRREDRVQVAADPEEDAGSDEADDGDGADDGQDESAARHLHRRRDTVTTHGYSKPTWPWPAESLNGFPRSGGGI